jgi:growth arrest-specific protein 8
MAMPLKQASEDVYGLKEQLNEHEIEKDGLRTVTATLLVVEDEYKRASWEREILQQKLERAEKEVTELQLKRAEVLRTLDQKNGFERLLLEKRIQATKSEISTREAQMHHVLVDVGKVQTQAVRQITDKPNPLSAKRDHLVALRRHLQTLDETYVNMVETVKTKLDEYGIAPNEMGFEPRASLIDL